MKLIGKIKGIFREVLPESVVRKINIIRSFLHAKSVLGKMYRYFSDNRDEANKYDSL